MSDCCGEELDCAIKQNKTLTEKVMLRDPLLGNIEKLNKVSLTPMHMIGEEHKLLKELAAPLRNVVKQQSADVTLLFAIRRPGCGFCREHGLQLSALAKAENVALVGVVKGNSTEEDNLIEFSRDYFKYEIYSDDKWLTYKLMGNRSIRMVDVFKGILPSLNRHPRKGIVNRISLTEDGVVQGGILVFDHTGDLKYCYNESFAEELDIESLQTAIRAVRVIRLMQGGSTSEELSTDRALEPHLGQEIDYYLKNKDGG
jgi:hypothetical protein